MSQAAAPAPAREPTIEEVARAAAQMVANDPSGAWVTQDLNTIMANLDVGELYRLSVLEQQRTDASGPPPPREPWMLRTEGPDITDEEIRVCKEHLDKLASDRAAKQSE